MITRREFSKVLLATGTASVTANSAFPAATGSPVSVEPQSTNQMCDLLIKGGTVIDPSQHLHGLMDVAVKDRKIQEVSRDIPENRALQVYSAKDKIVTPGFIDLHVHCFAGVGSGMNADQFCLPRGTTTVVDAGSTGFIMIDTFIKYIAKLSTTRIHALVEIGPLGTMIIHQYPNTHRYLYNSDSIMPQSVAKAVMDNRPYTVGVKIHLARDMAPNPIEFELGLLKKAVEAAEICHQPLMVHALNCAHPLPDLIKLMRKGDVFTHCYNGFPNGILDANGKIFPEVREARERGILFDVGADRVGISFNVVEKALQQDFLPDTISTDLTLEAANHKTGDLPNVVSTMMALGMDLEKVIERVTFNPAQAFDFGVKLGTLRPGAEADIGIFELRNENFEFYNNFESGAGGGENFDVSPEAGKKVIKHLGHQKLVNKAVVCGGQLLINEL